MSKILTTLTLASQLACSPNRAVAAQALANHVGCQAVLIYITAPNHETLQLAPGFILPLPNLIDWQEFLAKTMHTGRHQTSHLSHNESGPVSIVGRSVGVQEAIVFIGGNPDVGMMDILASILPMLRIALQEEQVALKAADLERSNNDLQQFAAIASHDLQEPLRMVTSFLGLLERQSAAHLNEKAKTYIGQASSSARRMSKLIRALLDYAQIGDGGRPFTAVPLEHVLKEAINNLAQRIAETHATVHVDELPKVEGDQILLVQLFQNFLGNALKFSRPHVPPVVRVTIQSNPTDVQIAISDNGIGIAAVHHELIFGVFQRLHTSAAFEGSGIGLATCRRIVERHHGRVWVESEPGVGSTFYIILKRSPCSSLVAS